MNGVRLANPNTLVWGVVAWLVFVQPACAQLGVQESLTASVRFEIDRDADQLLREARGSIERKNWPQAALELRRLLDEGEGRLVSDGETARSPSLEVARILRTLPGEARTAYARLTEAPAAEALAKAGADPTALLAVARIYPHTLAAEDSLWRLAQLYLDSGRFADASLALARLTETARDPGGMLRNTPDILFVACLATVMAGDVDGATEFAERFLPMIGAFDSPARRTLEDRINIVLRPQHVRDVHPPEATPTNWEFSAIPNGIVPDDVEQFLADLQEHSVVSYLQLRPIVIGDDLVARMLDRIVRLNGDTGDLVWEQPAPLTEPGLYGVAPFVESAMGDAVHSRLAADEQHVYFVVPGETIPGEETPQLANRLCALDLESGEQVWSLGEIDGAAAFFRGPPTPTPHGLLCLYESLEALQLAELDPLTGNVEWSARICELESGPSLDDRRFVHATPLVVAAGLAICPTGAGGIAAVDLLSHNVVWGFRFPREPLLLRSADAVHAGRNRRRLWAEGWSGGFAGVASGVLVLASPESDSLWGLDAATGSLRWRHPRGDGVTVATLNAEHAFVVGQNTVMSVRLSDGGSDWETKVGTVVGRAVVDGVDLVVPQRSGGRARVRISDGASASANSSEQPRVRIHPIHEEVPHNFRRPQSLVRVGGHLFTQSLDAIRPVRPGLAGDTIPEDDSQLTSLFEELRRSDESTEVTGSLQELLAFPLESYLVEVDHRCVRFDYAVVAALRQLAVRLAPTEGTDVDTAIAEVIDADGGPAAARLQELLSIWRNVEPLEAPRWSSAAELAKSELRLETQIATADAQAAAAALIQLLQLHDDRRDVREAAAVVDRLRQYEELVLSDGRSVAEVIAGRAEPPVDSADSWPQRTPTITSREWPPGDLYYLPVPVRAERGGLFEQLNVEVNRAGDTVRFSGAGFHRPWSVHLPPGGNLRSSLSADDLRHGWGFGHLLVLQVGADLFGIAPLDVTGEPRAKIIWPEPGETVSTGEVVAGDTLDPLAAAARRRAGVFWPAQRRLDRFGHPVGMVGPVTPAYFCVRRHGEIVAYETATGEEIWRIRDVSPDADCQGDVAHFVLRHGSSVQVRSALDGSLVRNESPSDHGTELLQRGVQVLYEQPRPDRLELSMVDLAAGNTVWTRQFKSGAESFPIDEELFGVFEKPDQLRFVSLKDGEIVASHALAVPDPLIQIVAFVDADSIYVVLTGARSSRGLEAATPGAGFHANDGAGRYIVNGPWYAFNRDSLELRWSGTLANASLSVNQPRDVPLIVTNELTFADEDAGRGVPTGRVRCFDRRTGEMLFDDQVGGVHTYFLVERDPAAGWVELRLAGRIVRFDYALPEPGAPESSNPENR